MQKMGATTDLTSVVLGPLKTANQVGILLSV